MGTMGKIVIFPFVTVGDYVVGGGDGKLRGRRVGD
jgi:hypothetical protein